MAYSDPRVVCTPWIADTDLCCAGVQDAVECDGVTLTPLTYQWTDAELIDAVSNLLFARTCYRYPGLCTRTVWPCGDCYCGCHPCACGTWSRLVMPTELPIDSITSVEIDGVPMNPADYRLDNDRYLVRMDGEHWPNCNSFALPNTSASEIRVTYVAGRIPPIELRMAAAEMVCEIKRACDQSATCALPDNVRSLVRRGVEIEINDVTDLLRDGMTGNKIIDHALSVHGKCSQHGKVFDPKRQGFRGYKVT